MIEMEVGLRSVLLYIDEEGDEVGEKEVNINRIGEDTSEKDVSENDMDAAYSGEATTENDSSEAMNEPKNSYIEDVISVACDAIVISEESQLVDEDVAKGSEGVAPGITHDCLICGRRMLREPDVHSVNLIEGEASERTIFVCDKCAGSIAKVYNARHPESYRETRKEIDVTLAKLTGYR